MRSSSHWQEPRQHREGILTVRPGSACRSGPRAPAISTRPALQALQPRRDLTIDEDDARGEISQVTRSNLPLRSRTRPARASNGEEPLSCQIARGDEGQLRNALIQKYSSGSSRQRPHRVTRVARKVGPPALALGAGGPYRAIAIVVVMRLTPKLCTT